MAVDRKQQMKEITERLEQGVKDMAVKSSSVFTRSLPVTRNTTTALWVWILCERKA